MGDEEKSHVYNCRLISEPALYGWLPVSPKTSFMHTGDVISFFLGRAWGLFV